MAVDRECRAGVDLGGSLIKVAYFANGELQFKIFASTSLDETTTFLSDQGLTELVLTGGGSVRHRQAFEIFQTYTQDEFTATITGANHLRLREGLQSFPYILVSIGTGTSVYRVSRSGGNRIAGTAIGGGTLLGLGRLLTGETRFQEIVALAAEGDRTLVDVLIRDIYGRDIPGLPGDTTASNFGKMLSQRPPDLARALFQFVGETISTVACLAAPEPDIQEVVYIGSSLRDNPVFREVLEWGTYFMDKKPRFLAHGEYVGAVGSLLKALPT